MATTIDISKYFRNNKCKGIKVAKGTFIADHIKNKTESTDGSIKANDTFTLFYLPEGAIPIYVFQKVVEKGEGNVKLGTVSDDDAIKSSLSIATKANDVTKITASGFIDKQLSKKTGIMLTVESAQTAGTHHLHLEVIIAYLDPERDIQEYIL